MDEKRAYKVKTIYNKKVNTHGDGQVVYLLSPPLTITVCMGEEINTKYVLVSSTGSLQGFSKTYVFECSKFGDVLSWRELPMSREGTWTHEEILNNAGYTIVSSESKKGDTVEQS